MLQYKNIYDMLPKILLIMSNLNYIVFTDGFAVFGKPLEGCGKQEQTVVVAVWHILCNRAAFGKAEFNVGGSFVLLSFYFNGGFDVC